MSPTAIGISQRTNAADTVFAPLQLLPLLLRCLDLPDPDLKANVMDIFLTVAEVDDATTAEVIENQAPRIVEGLLRGLVKKNSSEVSSLFLPLALSGLTTPLPSLSVLARVHFGRSPSSQTSSATTSSIRSSQPSSGSSARRSTTLDEPSDGRLSMREPNGACLRLTLSGSQMLEAERPCYRFLFHG